MEKVQETGRIATDNKQLTIDEKKKILTEKINHPDYYILSIVYC